MNEERAQFPSEVMSDIATSSATNPRGFRLPWRSIRLGPSRDDPGP